MRVVIWVIWNLLILYSATLVSYGAPIFRDKGDWLKRQESVKSSMSIARTSLLNNGPDQGSGEDSTFNRQKRLESDDGGGDGLNQLLSVSAIYTGIDANSEDSKVSSGDTTAVSKWDSKDESRGGEFSGSKGDDRKNTSDSRTLGETDLLEIHKSSPEQWPYQPVDTLGTIRSQAQVEQSQFHLPRVADRAASSALLSKTPPSLDEEQKEYESVLKAVSVHPRVQRLAKRQVKEVSRIMALSAQDVQNLPTNGAVDQVEEAFPDKFFERLKFLREKVFDLAEKIEKLKKSAGDMQITMNELQDKSKPLLLLYSLLKIELPGTFGTTKNSTSQLGDVGYEMETSSPSIYEGNMNSSVETVDHDSFAQMLNFFRDIQAERNQDHKVGEDVPYTVTPPDDEDKDVASHPIIQSNDDINLSRGQIDKLRKFLLKINVSQGYEDTVINLYHDTEDSNLSLSHLRKLLMQQDEINRNKNITQETDETREPLLPTSKLDAADNTDFGMEVFTKPAAVITLEPPTFKETDKTDETRELLLPTSKLDAADNTADFGMEVFTKPAAVITLEPPTFKETDKTDETREPLLPTSKLDAADNTADFGMEVFATPAAVTTLQPPTFKEGSRKLPLELADTGEYRSLSNSSKALTTMDPTAIVKILELDISDPSTNLKTNLSTSPQTRQMLRSKPVLPISYPVTTIEETILLSLSKEQTTEINSTVPAIVVDVFIPDRTSGITSHAVNNSAPPSIMEGTAPPNTHKEIASKIAQDTPQSYHDHTVLLIALLVAGLSCVILLIGVAVLCRNHRKKKERERVCLRYSQPRYTSYTPSDG